MGFKFEYKNAEELELAYKKLQAGQIKFMIKTVTDKDRQGYNLMNSKGNPYLKVVLVCVDANGQKGLVEDNISANAAWKVHDLCSAVGRLDLYSPSGDLDFAKLLGLQGSAILQDRTYTKGDGTTATVSSIGSYLPKTDNGAPTPHYQAQAQQARSMDEDLPF